MLGLGERSVGNTDSGDEAKTNVATDKRKVQRPGEGRRDGNEGGGEGPLVRLDL